MTAKPKDQREDDYAPVDGPAIAAKIINQMDPQRRSAILGKIKECSPDMFNAISGSLFTFEDLVHVAARGLQTLIKAVEHRVWVTALHNAAEPLISVILTNMSQRMAEITRDDLASLPAPTPQESASARKEIVDQVDTLRKAGLLRTEKEEDVWV